MRKGGRESKFAPPVREEEWKICVWRVTNEGEERNRRREEEKEKEKNRMAGSGRESG